MAKDQLTLVLEGDVPLDLFTESMRNLTELVAALARFLVPEAAIEWFIDDLSPGSATTTIVGVSEASSAVEQVVLAYEDVGRSLETGAPIRYPGEIEQYARKLTSVLDGKIQAISLRTDEDFEARITARFEEGERPSSLVFALGTVEGTVETLSRRRGLKFIVYDAIFDRGVTCYMPRDKGAIMRDIWGRRVVVFGRVGRDRKGGYPVKVVDVISVEIVAQETKHGDFRSAAGILGGALGDDLPEDVIRRLRDAW